MIGGLVAGLCGVVKGEIGINGVGEDYLAGVGIDGKTELSDS